MYAITIGDKDYSDGYLSAEGDFAFRYDDAAIFGTINEAVETMQAVVAPAPYYTDYDLEVQRA